MFVIFLKSLIKNLEKHGKGRKIENEDPERKKETENGSLCIPKTEWKLPKPVKAITTHVEPCVGALYRIARKE